MTENEYLVVKKFCTEVTKACIRRDCPPHIAWWRCNVIDMAERTEHIERMASMMQPDVMWY